MKVFVECQSGSDQKNVFNEETLGYKESLTVSRKYPYPYGFIQGTKSGDGACLDCFILTGKPLKAGESAEVQVIGMMEQFETRDGITKEDHNILARLPDEQIEITDEIKRQLTEFCSHVWDHRVGKKVEVGQFYGSEEAEKLIADSSGPHFRGTIIEESLVDASVLEDLKIIETKIEIVTKEHQTPWIKQWTLHTFQIPEEKADEFAGRVSKALDPKHQWYADFKNKDKHYIIFCDKVFYINRTQDEYEKVKEYGVSLGIPDYQLDFSPDIHP